MVVLMGYINVCMLYYAFEFYYCIQIIYSDDLNNFVCAIYNGISLNQHSWGPKWNAIDRALVYHR